MVSVRSYFTFTAVSPISAFCGFLSIVKDTAHMFRAKNCLLRMKRLISGCWDTVRTNAAIIICMNVIFSPFAACAAM